MSVPGPMLGPCESWITAADVEACCATPIESTDDQAWAESCAVEASMALYEISGRQFTGLCDRVVRPARTTCGCWGVSLGLGPWYWSAAPWGAGWWWGWRNENGDRLGCEPMSAIRLAGYPVREITQVLIDGVELPAVDDDGNPNWRLDKWRDLVRMDAPGPPVVRRFWPSCQNMSLEPSEPGTFEISYRCGVEPPELGRQAATALACQLYAACKGQQCALPVGTTKVTRQGIQVERGLLTNWFDPSKSTGIVPVDLFLAAYWSRRSGRRPALFSPDVQQFGRRIV